VKKEVSTNRPDQTQLAQRAAEFKNKSREPGCEAYACHLFLLQVAGLPDVANLPPQQGSLDAVDEAIQYGSSCRPFASMFEQGLPSYIEGQLAELQSLSRDLSARINQAKSDELAAKTQREAAAAASQKLHRNLRIAGGVLLGAGLTELLVGGVQLGVNNAGVPDMTCVFAGFDTGCGYSVALQRSGQAFLGLGAITTVGGVVLVGLSYGLK
jgi:hypothetical protein